MSNILPFEFEKQKIRIIHDDNGEALFVARDVASALGYAKPENAIDRHCKGTLKRGIVTPTRGEQQYSVIREPDVYRLIVKSNLPSAERFEAWVFEEVLPSIRKTGGYSVEKPMSQVELIAAQAQVLLEQSRKLEAIEAKQLEQDAKIDAILEGEQYYSVVAYCNVKRIKVDAKEAASIGRRASAHCRDMGWQTGTTGHPRFGTVKTYPLEAIEVAIGQ